MSEQHRKRKHSASEPTDRRYFVAADDQAADVPGLSYPPEQYGYQLHRGRTLADTLLCRLPVHPVICDDEFLNAQPDAVSFAQRRFLAARATQGDDGRSDCDSELALLPKVCAMVCLVQPPEDLVTIEGPAPAAAAAHEATADPAADSHPQPPASSRRQRHSGAADSASASPPSTSPSSKQVPQADADAASGGTDSSGLGCVTSGPLTVDAMKQARATPRTSCHHQSGQLHTETAIVVAVSCPLRNTSSLVTMVHLVHFVLDFL